MNHAVVNEDPNARIIRELRAEVSTADENEMVLLRVYKYGKVDGELCCGSMHIVAYPYLYPRIRCYLDPMFINSHPDPQIREDPDRRNK